MNEIFQFDSWLVILILGWIWNFIIFIKNVWEISQNIRLGGFSLYRFKHVKVLKVIYTKGYIPYYTLFKYQPFLDGYNIYKNSYETSDAIDYIHYLSLKKFSSK